MRVLPARLSPTVRVGRAPGLRVGDLQLDLAHNYLAEPLQPNEVRQAAGEALLTLLRRIPRRLERVTDALKHGRLNLNVRLLADERDRHWLTTALHNVRLTALAGVLGLMATLLLGLGGGPAVRNQVALNTLIG